MNRVPATPEERYAAVAEAFLSEPGVTGPGGALTTSRRFGAPALKVNNNIFAMLTARCFDVKLPSERVTVSIAAGS